MVPIFENSNNQNLNKLLKKKRDQACLEKSPYIQVHIVIDYHDIM